MPIWKSGSSAGRSKPGHKSIRGTISGPIPIPSGLEDDEFPIRNPGSSIATTANDDEFPIRHPGTGIASPVPPEEAETANTTPEQPPGTPQQQPPISQTQTQPQTPVQQQQPPSAGPSTVASVSGSRTLDVAQETQPEPSSDSSDATPIPGPAAAPAPAPVPIPVPVPVVVTAPAISPPPPPRSPAVRTPPQRASPQRISPAKPSPQSLPTNPRNSAFPIRQANAAAGNVRYSTVSDAPSGLTSQSKDAPQRKKSTLRSALGKIFGRGKKKNGGSPGSGARMSGPILAAQHYSEPPAPSNRNQESSPKRSASVPITEYDRPLRSHSIGADEIMAIESVRNSYHAEISTPRRRAATTSSRHFSTPRLQPEWGAGLSPRPVSSQGRGSKVPPGEEDPDEIGRAITSDGKDDNNGHRRRSRSLSGIGDIASSRPSVRRRSDEIRYWRESYDPGFLSPPLSATNDLDGEHHHEHRRDTAGTGPGFGVSSQRESLAGPEQQQPPKTPPQPFNFGSITHDMIGMKITQAASMDTRIGTLEARSQKLERVVTQLCHAVPGFRSPLMEVGSGRGEFSSSAEPAAFAYSTAAAPPTIPAIYQGRPSASSSRRESIDTDPQSQVSFGDAPTYIGSLHPPSSSATQPRNLTATAPAPATGINPLHRPTSTSTVRGAASLPTLGGSSSASGGAGDTSYGTLAAQLDAERAARQALESQVRKLSDRLNSLSTTLYAMVGGGSGPAKSRSQERLAPPMPKQPTPKALKALSVFETEDDNEVVKSPATEDDDEEPMENYQTPREEITPHSYGAFGEELRADEEAEEEDPQRKKAARTLSLSQLTLGRGVRTNI